MDLKAFAFIIDIILVYCGFIVSFLFRFPNSAGLDFFKLNFSSLPFLCLSYVFSLAFAGVYRNRFKSTYTLLQKVFTGSLSGLLVGMSFVYVFRGKWNNFPSSVFFISFPVIFLFLLAGKLILYKFFGGISKKVIFISEKELDNVNTLWSREFDEFVLTVQSTKVEQLYFLLKMAELKQAQVSILPELYDEMLAKKLNGKNSEVIFPAYFKNTPEEALIRFGDIFISLVLMILTLAVMALVAVLIKIDSKGRIIYKQERVGLNGKEFILYKFRSMVEGAAQFSRPEWVPLDEDSRVTRIGKILRKLRLDELPQLFNVLKGDMSLVGPRPEAVYRVKEHRALQGIRLSVRPGLTGLAQIEGYYHTKPAHKLKYDYLYIRNRSLSFNFKILFKTALVVLFKPGS